MCLNLVRATRSQGTGLLLRIRGMLDSETCETNRHHAYTCYVFINHTRSSLTKPSSSRNFDISIITHTYVIYLQHLYYSHFFFLHLSYATLWWHCCQVGMHSGGAEWFLSNSILVTQRSTRTLNESGAGSTRALKCRSLSLTRTPVMQDHYIQTRTRWCKVDTRFEAHDQTCAHSSGRSHMLGLAPVVRGRVVRKTRTRWCGVAHSSIAHVHSCDAVLAGGLDHVHSGGDVGQANVMHPLVTQWHSPERAPGGAALAHILVSKRHTPGGAGSPTLASLTCTLVMPCWLVA